MIRRKVPRIPTEILFAQSLKLRGCIKIYIDFHVKRSDSTAHNLIYQPISKRGVTCRMTSIEETWQLIDDIRLLCLERSFPYDPKTGFPGNWDKRGRKRTKTPPLRNRAERIKNGLPAGELDPATNRLG